jgi:hypothetical protein
MENTQNNYPQELAWITFMGENYENEWYPIMMNNRQLIWDDIFIMEICRERYINQFWGISNTSQMLINNSLRNNL